MHGHERGSIDRFRNLYKSPYINANNNWHKHNLEAMRGQPVMLDASQRQSVEAAVRETCSFRQWHLHVINVRTNHVHVVVSLGPIPPERALTAFKANATRQMRRDGCWRREYSPWAQKGSNRYLWNERGVLRAINYVLFGQGDELPRFDED